MSPITLLLVALGLAMDAFAAAIAASIVLRTVSARQVFRLAFHLGLFQALMPVIGWTVGTCVGTVIAAWDHWLAFALLTLVGGKAIYEAFSRTDPRAPRDDPTRGFTLVALSIATSLDALAVGASLAFLGVDIWIPSVVIGLVACALTALGMLAGSRLGARFGQRVEIAGGLVLIGIGVKIVVEHSLATVP